MNKEENLYLAIVFLFFICWGLVLAIGWVMK